jgi:glycosyltransferase involved in cell wall biosynthesis
VFYFDDKKVEIDLGVATKKLSFFRKYNFMEYDIIHTTGARPDIYAMLYCSRKKWIVSMHNYFIDDLRMQYSALKAFFFITLWKQALKNTNNMILSSSAMLEYYQKILGFSKRYSIIPYGITDKPYTEINPDDQEVLESFKSRKYIILGSVGLLIYRKGFHQILEFMKNHDNFACIIIGEGDQYSNLKEKIREYYLEGRTFLPGFRNNSYNYYKYIDIYMHTSYSEGFGLAMLEAMSKRIPIVCSNLPIYNDYFSSEDVALFETNNINSLKTAVFKSVNNKAKYSLSSYNLFCNKFSAKVMAKSHIQYYRNVMIRG